MVSVINKTSGCSNFSETFRAIKTAVTVIRSRDYTCIVYPNPNNGLFTIEVESNLSGEVMLGLFSPDGKQIAKRKLKHSSGKQMISFGKSSLINGVYTLQISLGKETVSRKLIVKH